MKEKMKDLFSLVTNSNELHEYLSKMKDTYIVKEFDYQAVLIQVSNFTEDNKNYFRITVIELDLKIKTFESDNIFDSHWFKENVDFVETRLEGSKVLVQLDRGDVLKVKQKLKPSFPYFLNFESGVSGAGSFGLKDIFRS